MNCHGDICLATTIDHVFGTTFQNLLDGNRGYYIEENGYHFRIRKDNIAEIAKYKGKENVLVIPSCYENNVSTRISPFAFSKNKNIISVDIPDSVSVIGQESFFRCFGLRKVHLPKNLLYIDKNAFNSCIKLEEIDIPEKVIHIERAAFFDCKSLKKAIIHNNVGFIGKNAFKNTAENFEIICKKGSYADSYAKENGLKTSYI